MEMLILMAIQFPSIHGSGIKEAQSVSVINIFISCFRYLLLLLLRIAEDRQNVENENIRKMSNLHYDAVTKLKIEYFYVPNTNHQYL
ncbi:hypothetical protein DERF_002045 [Dermatophagoides farinae]|uniref:Uncharacterized protein n=1 Tax=Dermatophagoides farinae TaxID=6954 RepID=A0A922L991_DERFA|nr:hypothetical protein DERF_002045 [Dermatophagoides farinae]